MVIALLTVVCLHAQNRYDVLITEIMADPSPQVGLPNAEWIELKNVSATAVNLQNWRIGDSGGLSGNLPAYILQPDSFVIICTASALAQLSAFGPAVAVSSFPSLDNDGELLFLRNAAAMTLHAVAYASSWYHNETKKEGGWSLEMTDTQNPCGGMENWKAAVHPAGGTPGRVNSVQAINRDDQPPRLLRSYTRDSLTVILVFDEPVDSSTASAPGHYQLDGGISLSQALPLAPLFTQVQLKTTTALQPGLVYILKAGSLRDCRGNTSAQNGEVKTGLPAEALPGEWIINEILFNPRSTGTDFVELMNNCPKILDASKLFIANRNSSGTISSIRVLSPEPFYVFPGERIAVTEDRGSLLREYFVQQPALLLQPASMPSFPDEEGYVLALGAQGQVLDEVHYRDDWHFALISNTEGISLEKIEPGAASQDPSSWHSAASGSGYATPTALNSQYRNNAAAPAMISCSPKMFSPDNDGRDDILSIQYSFPEPGYVASITLFDVAGRPVRYLVRNALVGVTGQWFWDGLGEQGKQLPAGPYILLSECFNLQGKKFRERQALVLARPLR